MEITINKKIIVQEELSEDVEKITITNVHDDLKSKVSCSILISPINQRNLVLWEGEDYVKIGNWVYEDVKNRIIELL